MNIKELAKDVYDAVLSTVPVEEYDRELDGDDFDAASDAAVEAVDTATEVTDEAEDEDEEDGGDAADAAEVSRQVDN